MVKNDIGCKAIFGSVLDLVHAIDRELLCGMRNMGIWNGQGEIVANNP